MINNLALTHINACSSNHGDKLLLHIWSCDWSVRYDTSCSVRSRRNSSSSFCGGGRAGREVMGGREDNERRTKLDNYYDEQ